MVSSMRSKILVLLLLCFCINLTVANRWAFIYMGEMDSQQSPVLMLCHLSSTGGNNGGSNGENDVGQCNHNFELDI
jgi:hypothetical protein